MRIAVVGNCQTHGIGDAVKQLAPDADILALEAPQLHEHGALDHGAAVLEGCDLILAQFLSEHYGPLATKALRVRFPQLAMLPIVAFTGFQPDCTYIRHAEHNYGSPMGPYNSAIVAAGFSLGLSPERTAGLFNAFIFRKLGYFDEFAKAEAHLREEAAKAGLDISEEWRLWREAGVFMHTINHPRPLVLASLAKLALVRAGVVPAGTATPEPIYDWAANFQIWPVYPELADALGVTGGTVFKRDGPPDMVGGRGVLLTLREFIEGSYAHYAGYPREVFDTPVVARTRAAIAPLLGPGG